MEVEIKCKCKDCENFDKSTNICESWGSWTKEDGFCFKAEKDNTKRQQSDQNYWHEEKYDDCDGCNPADGECQLCKAR